MNFDVNTNPGIFFLKVVSKEVNFGVSKIIMK